MLRTGVAGYGNSQNICKIKQPQHRSCNAFVRRWRLAVSRRFTEMNSQPGGRRIAVFENEDAEKWKGWTEKVCLGMVVQGTPPPPPPRPPPPPPPPPLHLADGPVGRAVVEKCSSATRR